MEGLQRWDITSGPGSLRAGSQAQFDLSMLVVPGLDVRTESTNVTIAIYDVQRLGPKPVFSFVGGRLFADGNVMVVWGVLDTSKGTGALWLLSVPEPYTGVPTNRRRTEFAA